MTKEELEKKIEELKAEKDKIQHEADLQDVFQHSYKIFLNSVRFIKRFMSLSTRRRWHNEQDNLEKSS